ARYPLSLHDALPILELSYRPVELRSLIERANAERKVITAANVEQRFKNGDPRYLDVAVTPLQDNGVSIGVCISFNDVTRYHGLEDRKSTRLNSSHDQ